VVVTVIENPLQVIPTVINALHVHVMNTAWWQATANLWTWTTSPTKRQPLNRIHHHHHYYSARKLTLILSSHRRQKA